MNVTRRDVTIGGISLLASASMGTSARAEFGEFLGIGGGLEEFALATDAYVFGYPLVTMEMTRSGHHQRRSAGGDAGADGANHQAAQVS